MQIKDITPAAFICHTSNCCPAVLETADHYIIIGKKLSPAAQELVQGRVGADEYVIEVQKGMIDGLR